MDQGHPTETELLTETELPSSEEDPHTETEDPHTETERPLLEEDLTTAEHLMAAELPSLEDSPVEPLTEVDCLTVAELELPMAADCLTVAELLMAVDTEVACSTAMEPPLL